MGLIGLWLGSLYFACPFVVMPPMTFLARPERWLRTIDYFRGTLSAAPNFVYEFALSKVADHSIEGLDLSSWRMASNGAERIARPTIERFIARYEPLGFRAKAMTPIYGLAESAVALTTSGRLIVLAECRQRDPAKREHPHRQIAGLVSNLMGTPPDEVVLASSGTVIKTPNGKVRRSACRQLCESGRLDRRRRPFGSR